jgi:hypothetical protein
MKVITTICIPSDIYRFFYHESENHICRTPEELMANYLSAHARRIIRKRNKRTSQFEAPAHQDPDRDIPFPSPQLFF